MGFLAAIGGGNLWVGKGGGWKNVGGRNLERVSVSPKTGHCLTIDKAGTVSVWKDGGWVKLPGKFKDVGTGKSNDDEVIVTIP